jgi:hypothetical protein
MAAEVDAYFAEIELADDLRKAGKTEEALAGALRNLARVPALITETVAEDGSFDIGRMPPIDDGCTLAAILGDALALKQIEEIVVAHAELEPFRQIVVQGYEDLETVWAIRAHVTANPGCAQSTLGKALGIDGRRTSSLIRQLLLAGFITRQEQGHNYALFSSTAGPDAHDRLKRGQDPVFVIDAARRIGTAEGDLRARGASPCNCHQFGRWMVGTRGCPRSGRRGQPPRTTRESREPTSPHDAADADGGHLAVTAHRGHRNSIEIRQDESGPCTLRLSGDAAELARWARLDDFAVSLGHEGNLAVAVVFARGRNEA